MWAIKDEALSLSCILTLSAKKVDLFSAPLTDFALISSHNSLQNSVIGFAEKCKQQIKYGMQTVLLQSSTTYYWYTKEIMNSFLFFPLLFAE